MKVKVTLKGFTLTELLIAVSVFSFVALLVTTIIFSANATNDRLAASRTVYEAVNLVLDDMVREISQGTKYRCLPSNEFATISPVPTNLNKTRDCDLGAYGIAFTPSEYSSYYATVTDQIATGFNNPISRAGYVLQNGTIRRYSGVLNIDGFNNVANTFFNRGGINGSNDYNYNTEVYFPGSRNETILPSNITVKKFLITATNTDSYVEDTANIGQAYLQIIIEGETNTKPIIPFSVQTTITQREPEN
jgi:prepilin-type N-terminal cleavage/methylation domain-containing protein